MSLADTLDALESRWAGGAPALAAAPADWHPALDGAEGAEAELRLLALAAQAARLALRPATEGIEPRHPLPRLALPTMDAAARPRFREAREALGPHAPLVVAMAAARGVTAHPLDWMPAPGEDAPEVYAPWHAWRAGADGPDAWDDLSPAPRRAMLRALRRRDPAAARALLEARLSERPAEERALLVEVLGHGLSDDDAPLLGGLAADRSGRVRDASASLLARLGRLEPSGDAEAIRAAILRETEGLIRRRTVFRPAHRPRRGTALRTADREALAGATMDGLCAAFGTDAASFLAAWEWGASQGHDSALATLLARSGDDAAVASALPPLLDRTDGQLAVLLAPRLDAAGRALLLSNVLSRPLGEGPPLLATLSALPPSAGAAPIDLDPAPLLTALGEAKGPHRIDRLQALGLVLPRARARATLDALIAAGHALADPALAPLRLSAALPDPTGDAP